MQIGRYTEAIVPFEKLANARFKKKDSELRLVGDTRVKLGYCNILAGNIETGMDWFRSVDKEDESYKGALIGLAWMEYKQDHFDAVDTLTVELIEKFPDDPEFYEATTLSGFNRELLGQHDNAMVLYEDMINVLSKLNEVRSYISERRIIAKRIKEAKNIEKSVVDSDDPELFKSFLDLTSELDRLYKRVKLGEITELNPEMKDFVLERDTIRALYSDLTSLHDSIVVNELHSLEGAYNRLDGRLRKLARSVQLAGYGATNRLTVTQRAAKAAYHNEVTDSLISRSENELLQIQEAMIDIQSVRHQMSTDGSEVSTWISLDMALADLTNSQLTYEENIAMLSEGKMEEIRTDIEKWRDFAFQRYALADLDFDYLLAQMNMLNDLSGQLSTISKMILAKEIEAEADGFAEEASEDLPGEIETEEAVETE